MTDDLLRRLAALFCSCAPSSPGCWACRGSLQSRQLAAEGGALPLQLSSISAISYLMLLLLLLLLLCRCFCCRWCCQVPLQQELQSRVLLASASLRRSVVARRRIIVLCVAVGVEQTHSYVICRKGRERRPLAAGMAFKIGGDRLAAMLARSLARERQRQRRDTQRKGTPHRPTGRSASLVRFLHPRRKGTGIGIRIHKTQDRKEAAPTAEEIVFS